MKQNLRRFLLMILLIAACGETQLGLNGNQTLVQKGEGLFQKYSCINCHAKTNESGIGPGLGGLVGSEVKLTDGSTLTADEAYVRESILNPKAKMIEGDYKDVMPAFTTLSEDELSALVEFVKTLK